MCPRASVILLAFLHAVAVAAPSQVRLCGIVSFADTKFAILEGERRFGQTQWVILEPGQVDNLGAKIDLIEINPSLQCTAVRVNDTNYVTLLMKSKAPIQGVVLEDAPMDATLEIYARFAQRTLLRHPLLRETSFNLAVAANTQAEAASALKAALTRLSMISINDGDKFLMLVPTSEAEKVQPHSIQLKGLDRSHIEPAGFINFPRTDLGQAAAIYAELAGQQLDSTSVGAGVADGRIYLKTMTSMTRNEALYAFETLFAWRGLKLVPAGDGKVKLVRL